MLVGILMSFCVVPESQTRPLCSSYLVEYNVESFIHDDLMVSVSYRKAGQNPKTAEDDLLDATADAMKQNPDFSIGCKTVRNNL